MVHHPSMSALGMLLHKCSWKMVHPGINVVTKSSITQCWNVQGHREQRNRQTRMACLVKRRPSAVSKSLCFLWGWQQWNTARIHDVRCGQVVMEHGHGNDRHRPAFENIWWWSCGYRSEIPPELHDEVPYLLSLIPQRADRWPVCQHHLEQEGK